MNWFPAEARSRKRGAPIRRGREKAARRLNSPKLQEAPVEKAEEQGGFRVIKMQTTTLKKEGNRRKCCRGHGQQ